MNIYRTLNSRLEEGLQISINHGNQKGSVTYIGKCQKEQSIVRKNIDSQYRV